MHDAIKRYLTMFLGVTGALASGSLVVRGLMRGSLPGLGRGAVTGTMYSAASQASQFWFLVFFWFVACAGFIWLAWSAYRD